MRLLAIDTITEMCSLALLIENEIHIKEQFVPQQHTQAILPMLEEILVDGGVTLSDIDAIAFSRGPGSFTGLRICASVTQGLALAHDIPVIPVSSLACLAQSAWRIDKQNHILACLDARKNEVYWACFSIQDNVVSLVGEEQVSPPAEVRLTEPLDWHGVGSGFARFVDELNTDTLVNLTSCAADRYPLAQDLLPSAVSAWQKQEYVDASLALPIYLRDNVAVPKA